MKARTTYIRLISGIIFLTCLCGNAKSQCDILATADNQVADTVYICDGEHVKLHSWGDCDDYLMDNNFNNGSIGAGWSTNASPMFNNPCVPGPDGSTCLWIGPATNFPRELVTVPFSVTTSCTICFDMIYSVQGVSSPCEGPDLPTEGVHLQWSNNGGTTWTDIQYWAPNGGHDPTLTNWNNYCCNVPVGGANIQFRWYQSNTSGNNYDHWGIDNVVITCPQTSNVWWTGPGGFSYNNYHPPSFAPTQSGWYVVHLSDGTYTAMDSIYVNISTPILASITPANPILCFGQTSTTITAAGTGGSPPYSYLWNTGATTPSIVGGTGVYTVIIRDASPCPPATASVTITSFISPIVANAGPDQVICIQSSTISLNGSVSGATGGIWSGGSGTFLPNNTSLNATYTPTPTEITAGQVNLTLTTTGNGLCPAATDVTHISFVNFQGSPVLTPAPVSCFGGNNGSVSVNVVGGAPPFTYIWNTTPPQTGQTINNLTIGTYSITITDANGCTTTSSAQISQPNPLTALITSTNVSCFSGGNATATVSAFGGTPGYSYQWSNGYSGITVNGLSANTYTATVTDANNCQVTASVVISSPSALTATINTYTPVNCNGGHDGTAQVSVTGGTPGYSYLWSSSMGTSSIATGLTAGNYFVTVTDANGCMASASVNIAEPSAINVTTIVTDATCYGATNGSASLTVTGGTSPYYYAWSPSGGNSAVATNLMGGIYTVSITDSHGCQTVRIINIQQPLPITISLNSSNNVSCYGGNNGSASVSVSGGVPGYTYSWLPTGGSGPVALGLPSGNYIVSVTDANSCSSQLAVSINQPSSPISLSFSQLNASCYGSNNGSITANPAGGTPPYTYSWNPGSATTSTITNLVAGTYQVTVTDVNMCTLAQSITITQPSSILLSTSFSQATCNNSNGSATVNAFGGTIPYTYLWSPGGGTTQSINNIPAAAYTVTVTDLSGCSQTAFVLVTNVAGPQVTMTSIQNVSCFGGFDGAATVSVTGGAPPYTYSWAPYGGSSATAANLGAGTYTVTVTDSNGCQGLQVTSPSITQPQALSIITHQVNITCTGANNGSASLTVSGGTPGYTYVWSSGGTTSNISGLLPGIHNVTVTDANGCQDFAFVDIVEPLPVSANISATQNVSCNGGSDGSATVNVTGGTLPFTFNWSPSGASSQTATGLATGTHTVYVTDNNGCSASVSVFISQPTPLSIITGHTNASCNNSFDAIAWVLSAGGTPPYSYSWSPSGGINDTATGLGAGTYFITVTDNNACQLYNVVTISQPITLLAEILNFSNINCYGGSDGSITASVSGGTPGYTYLWSTSSTSPTITGLTIGSYAVTITDSKGCYDSTSIYLTEPLAPLALTISSQNVSCYGNASGAATANVTGGTAPYTYIWVPAGQISQTANNLIAGTYTVSVIDVNGCQISSNIVISQPQLLTSGIQVLQTVLCSGTNTGSASVLAMGGTPPYDYTWNTTPIQTTSTAQNIYAGVLTVTVTDQGGCTTVSTSYMTEPPILQSTVISHTDVSCYDGSNGIATSSATGGSPPYYFSWNTNPVQNSQSATGLASGNYSVTVTDANSCSDISTVTIVTPTQVITTANGGGTLCLGDSVQLTASASGGAGNYMYFWNQGLGIGSSYTVSPGTDIEYVAIAYDQNGCIGIPDTASIHILSLLPGNVNMYITSPVCPGTAAQVYVTATASSFDTLYYTWNESLGPGPGPFVVAPSQETTYIVTVTNACGFSVIDSARLYFTPPPTVHFIPDITQGCMPVTVSFTDSSFSLFDYAIDTWYWSFGDSTFSNEQNPTHTFLTPDTFWVYLNITTSGGCTQSSANSPYPIYVFENPQASFTMNSTTLYLPNDPAICTNTSTGAVAYIWNFGDSTTSVEENPTHYYTELGHYNISLVAINMYNCTDTATIKINATGDIRFPNAFTPDPNSPSSGENNNQPYNYTNLNTIFFPYSTGVSEFSMMVFNRWGELIFESDDINTGWDGYYRGKLCQQDVYVYKANATFFDGRKVEKVGDIMLLR